MSVQERAQHALRVVAAKTGLGSSSYAGGFGYDTSTVGTFAQSPLGLFLVVLGSVWLAVGVARFASVLLDLYVLPGIPLTKFGARPKARGEAAWAVVTGATDGIGREFALQLAKRGFHVLLASRTAEKLGKVAAEVEAQAPGVQTKVHAIDFGAGDERQYAALEAVLEGLNIGVLVNNVGKSNEMPVPFVEQSKEEMLAIAEINVMATLRVTRMVAPGMVERNRGLILNLGSFSGQFPVPLLTTYAGTKTFLIGYSQALGEELRRSKVVVQNLNTYFVVSNLSGIRRSSFVIPTAKQYVGSVLGKIGRQGGAVGRPYNMTPYPAHALIDWLVTSTISGTHMLLRFNYDSLLKIRQRALKRAAKRA